MRKWFDDLPGIVEIKYNCEYIGPSSAVHEVKTRHRKAKEIQKIWNNEFPSHSLIVLEMIPEQKPWARGKYKISFPLYEILLGQVEIWSESKNGTSTRLVI